ncbi:Putative GTP cyclohydrolase 1 type 2, NIF3 family [Pilibacter termitis]|uniref:GTP cyclohydrolase 1 type 2 homolog n=1 Tax=Pilibacter termitis TaxID=263852 RepID=A0A1T4L178_9ENTE|nr:Nif3-like dinuclear metal center hexameric protein [Pilibacter termitis]SJZ48290.1 Putative GTP cyclohydrolase 1 type 2, NIF3 family [Pilibacter termitis]
MNVRDIMEKLSQKVSWVNPLETKDRLLFGKETQEVKRVIVTWVASVDIIKEAIEKKVDLIITHENPFYLASTSTHQVVERLQNEKYQLLEKGNIAVYRCHDLWDLYPEIGVRDVFASQIPVVFAPAKETSFYRYGAAEGKTMREIATFLEKELLPYGQTGVVMIGDENKPIKTLGIGTGAITSIIQMIADGADAFVVTDDGVNNWIDIQLAQDLHFPVLMVNHYASEAKGIEQLASYLQEKLREIEVSYVPQKYRIKSSNRLD